MIICEECGEYFEDCICPDDEEDFDLFADDDVSNWGYDGDC